MQGLSLGRALPWPSRAGALPGCLGLPLPWLLTLLLALAGACLPLRARAQDLQPVPALTARVVDTIGLLGAQERAQIEARLATLDRDKGIQVAFLLVASTQPEDIASYANRVANAWKIGRRNVGDGVLLVVARDDRKLRIEVAKTLEGVLPDLKVKQIMDVNLTPAFRRGDYAGGLLLAAEQISSEVRGEPLPEPGRQAQRQSGTGPDWGGLAFLLLVAVPVLAKVLRHIFGRKLGTALTCGGAGLIAWLVSASLGIAALAGLSALALSSAGGLGPLARYAYPGRRGGWGGSGGAWGGGAGGGGFRSGGGGDFGGGGASGDW